MRGCINSPAEALRGSYFAGMGLAIALASLPACQVPTGPGGPWAHEMQGRVCLRVEAGGVAREDRQAEVDVDFDRLIAEAGLHGELAVTSLRVVEIDGNGSVLDPAVAFQFDPDLTDDTRPGARGTLVFTMSGTTDADQRRFYHVYFDTRSGDSFAAAKIPDRVRVENEVEYAGQESFKIVTLDTDGFASAVYYYHREGAGFAGMVDGDGNDWIAYSRAEGHLGEWRGIPNLGWDQAGSDSGFGHPGYTTATSEVVHAGPLKVTLRSTSSDGPWECYWEITPDRAKLTVTKVPPGRRYWFLYEGTPGGRLDGDDLCVRSPGRSSPLDREWAEDLRTPEWVYFASRHGKRALFLAHLDNDWREDSYYRLESMTVFGFGRGSGDRYLEGLLTTVPNRFVIGFAEAVEHSEISRELSDARTKPRVLVGRAESTN